MDGLPVIVQGFDTTNPSVPLYKTVREIEEYEEY